MASSQPEHSPFERFLRWLITYLLQDWQIVLLDLYKLIRKLVVREQPTGVYEILEYESTLELLDAKGKKAIFKRHQKVKFLQDNITVFQDHAWGDGDIFADYKCSPGVVVDRYREGDRWNILISLRETKSKGDISEFYIERTTKNSFLQAEEWWQVEVWCKTWKLTLALLFPKDRPCRRAVLQTRGENKTVVLDQSHFHKLPDGRQLLKWEAEQPNTSEVYTIRWTW